MCTVDGLRFIRSGLRKTHKHWCKMADEKLCLKWNDFQNIVQTSLGELRRSRDFIDVTLACEDMSINAHKIILSSCSPFFKRLLRAHTNPHPLIFMRGIKSRDLEAIMDFIYLGEANIFQEQFETFWLWQKSWSLRDSVGIQRELLQKMNLSLIPFRESLKKRPREWHMWDNRGEKWKNDDQQHSSHFIDGNSLSDKTSHDNFSWNKRHNWVIDWRPAWGTFLHTMWLQVWEEESYEGTCWETYRGSRISLHVM